MFATDDYPLAVPKPTTSAQADDELEQGGVLNAAVFVRDPARIPRVIEAIEAAGRQRGLALKAVSWQTAAGVVGQFTVLLRFVLFGAVTIVFLVALVIIGNALVIATLERVREIGTLRAIGAQRSFILGMLTTESATIGGVFGGLGALCGACLVWTLGRVGIPAANDVFTFVFAGPRLVPRLSAAGLLGALVSVLCVSVLAGIYPAWLAMRVSPREAMQGEE